MKIGLFIPCYVDAVYPEVGLATWKLLKHLGLDVSYPEKQTCCGQPMANAGFEKQAIPLAEKFEEKFKGFDYVVSPSVSCTAFIRLNYPRLLHHECETAKHCMDVVEFLHDVVKVDRRLGTFPIESACTTRVTASVNWDCRRPANSMSGSIIRSRTCCRWLTVSTWWNLNGLTNAVALAVCSPSRRLPYRHRWERTKWSVTSRPARNMSPVLTAHA